MNSDTRENKVGPGVSRVASVVVIAISLTLYRLFSETFPWYGALPLALVCGTAIGALFVFVVSVAITMFKKPRHDSAPLEDATPERVNTKQM